MASPGDLEAGVAANSRQVLELRSEVRDFRQATTASFNAMRSDFTDLRSDFSDLRSDFADLRTDFADLRSDLTPLQAETRTGFAEIRGRLDGTAAGLEQITSLLARLIDQ